MRPTTLSAWCWSTLARLRGLVRGGRLDAEFEQELHTHLAMAADEKVRHGMTPQDARRAARVELGGVSQLREAGRAARGLPWLETCWLDAKLGLRMLGRSWGLTLIGGLAMIIAIGPGAIVFGLIDAVFWRPLPLDDGDRVVAIQTWDMAAYRRIDTSMADFGRWRDRLQSVEDIGAFRTTERTFAATDTAAGSAERVLVAEMTASGFQMARVQPLLGRPLLSSDEREGADPVVVIAYDTWRSRFSSDPAIVGRTVRLDATIHTVVGVMPDGFAFPLNHRFWVPLPVDPMDHVLAGPDGTVFGRLTPGVSLETAQAELSTLGLLPDSAAAALDTRDARPERRPVVTPYIIAFTDDVQRGEELALRFSIPLLLASLLLIPPCANTAILVYARTVARQQEFVTRHALGASRRRIVGQLFVETLVLASCAAGAALLLAPVVLGRAQAILSAGLNAFGGAPFWWDFGLSPATILFAFLLALGAAAIAGLLPALQATGRLLRARFRSSGRSTGIPLGWMWTGLVVLQIALCLAALPSAAEMAWGTLRPGVLGPGFPADEFLTVRLGIDTTLRPSEQRAPTETPALLTRRFRDLQAEVVRQMEATPGVTAPVSTVAAVPGEEPPTGIEVDEGSAGARRIRRYVFRGNRVDEAFFETLGVPLVAGRTFTAADFDAAVTPVIVDETFARQVTGAANPLGRRVRPARPPTAAPGAEEPPWYEIVGVVAARPANTPNGRIYYPAARATPGPILIVRTGADPSGVLARLREIVTDLDPTLRLVDVRRLDEVYRWQQGASNLIAIGLGLVTLSVLLLSAGGLYALMSFTVARRRREIGIRSALGGQSVHLLGGVFRRALWQVGAGAGLGILAASVLHRGLNVEVAGGWHLPGVLPAAAAFMILIGLLAAIVPARRALRIAPTEALRDDG